MPADKRWSLVNPNGRPLFRYDEGGRPAEEMVRVEEDRRVTVVADGESLTLKREQILMAMARARRDGASLKRIIHDFDLVGEARHPRVLGRALDEGDRMLTAAIARGEEPEESVLVLDIPKVDWDESHNPTVDDTPTIGRLPDRDLRIRHN